MRARTFILLFIVLLVAAAAIVTVYLASTGWGPLAGIVPGTEAEEETPQVEVGAQEPGGAAATATPEVRYATVVVARVDMPVGERITSDLVTLERRPDTNVAVLAGVTFENLEDVIGQITKTEISRGQEILRPMLALSSTDLATIGSDLGLYVDQGKVAVSFPIDSFSGAAFAMRPGDLVDVLMSMALIQVDEEFQTARSNLLEQVYEPDLLEGRAFLFEPTKEGRLELIPVLNIVGVIGPGAGQEQIPRRVTQLTLQQLEVLWVGNWLNPVEGLSQEFAADAIKSQREAPPVAEAEDGQPRPVATPTKQRPEDSPDVVILSLPVQDALVLKYATEVGIDLHLVLRSQGDNSVFITTSVSLPQLVEQGGLFVPDAGEFSLEPRIELVPTPGLPDVPEALETP
jgi:Flp pilus assembly protein CpaB